MNVLEMLEKVGKMDRLIDAKIAERERLMEIACNITAKPIDDMPHGGTGMVSDRLGNTIAELAEQSKEIDRAIDNYVDYKNKVTEILEELPEIDFAILHRYYIRHMTDAQIGADLGYSRVQAWRIRKKALENLNMKLNATSQV